MHVGFNLREAHRVAQSLKHTSVQCLKNATSSSLFDRVEILSCACNFQRRTYISVSLVSRNSKNAWNNSNIAAHQCNHSCQCNNSYRRTFSRSFWNSMKKDEPTNGEKTESDVKYEDMANDMKEGEETGTSMNTESTTQAALDNTEEKHKLTLIELNDMKTQYKDLEHETSKLNKKLRETQEALRDAKSLCLETLDDQKKMVQRHNTELESMKHFGISAFAKSLLDVIDSLDAAKKHADELKNHSNLLFDRARDADGVNTSDSAGMKDKLLHNLKEDDIGAYAASAEKLIEGIHVTTRALQATMERHDITQYDPISENFDPNFHEALFEVVDGDKKKGEICQVVQKGYHLHGRVIRAAKVGVYKN